MDALPLKLREPLDDELCISVAQGVYKDHDRVFLLQHTGSTVPEATQIRE